MRTRRICVGTLFRNGNLVENGNLRSRKCLSVNWRGIVEWCQPWQFANLAALGAAVDRRLAIAGLGVLELRVGTDGKHGNNGTYEPIMCVVVRLRRPHARAVRANKIRNCGSAATSCRHPRGEGAAGTELRRGVAATTG